MVVKDSSTSDGDRDQEDDTMSLSPWRWVTLLLFISGGLANSMLLLTFAPISDKATVYFGSDVNLTMVNLLNVIFSITYIPGTILALEITDKLDLRHLMVTSGFLTTAGCFIRFMGIYLHNQRMVSGLVSYLFVLLGTSFAALSQPSYLNLPAKIANLWFPLQERDIATTFASMANPLGSALGAFMSGFIVTDDSDDDSVSSLLKKNFLNLTLTQICITGISFLSVLLFFKAAPEAAPTLSAANSVKRKQDQTTTREKKLIVSDNSDHDRTRSRTSSTSSIKAALIAVTSLDDNSISVSIYRSMGQLLKNVEYMKLLFSFSLLLGNLNAICALINQLPGSDTYSSSQVGNAGALLIITGFLGALLMGFVLESTKAYRFLLKGSYIFVAMAWIFFMANCRDNNYILFIIASIFVGSTSIPAIPATIINTVECSHPVEADASVGLLYVGANSCNIVFTFIGQVILGLNPPSHTFFSTAPFFPYGIFVIICVILFLLPVLSFKGEYLRLKEDTEATESIRSSLLENNA